MTNQQRYDTALFNQLLARQLDRVPVNGYTPKDIKGCIGRALREFAPAITVGQQTEYVQCLYETITDKNDAVRSNWRELVAEHHGGQSETI